MKRRRRTLYLDVLRVLATFFVMLLHISAKNWSAADVTSLEWGVMNVGDSLSRWGVPVFTMISGALFLDRKVSIRVLFQKNIRKIAVVFVCWSALYAGYGFSRHRDMGRFVEDFLRGHYHMWYLYMIIGLYMIVPFLRRIARHEALVWYFLILGFVFAILVPQILSAISIFHAGASDLLRDVIEKYHMYFVLGYPFYFILGSVLHRHSFSAAQVRAVIPAGILGFASTICLSSAVSMYRGRPEKMFYNNFTVNVLLEALFVFVVVKQCLAGRRPEGIPGNLITKLSELSLGAFLVHAFLIETLDDRFHINTTTGNPVLTLPLLWLGVAAASFLISWILHQIPLVKKWLV